MAQDKTYIEIGSNIPQNGVSERKNPSGVAAMNIQINAGQNVTTVVEGVLADIQGAEQPQESDWVEVARFVGPGIFPLKNVPSLFRVKALGGPIERVRAMGYRDPKAVPETIPASIADITSAIDPILEPVRAAANDALDSAEAAGESLARVRVDATLYGVVEGADVSTLMAAIAATPNGGTLTCPKVNLVHNGGRLIINARSDLTIEGNGLKVTARSDLPDPSTGANGGFYFINCTEIDVWDMTYDGRLDTRTPYGGDLANTNLKSGWNVLSGCVGVRLHNVHGNRCMMDGIYVGHTDDTTPQFPGSNVAQANMPINTVLDRCGGDGNYRQGLSVVGCNGLTGSGNKFHRTGKTGNKGTLPKAGIDFEAYTLSGFFNLGVDLTDTECNENVGHAVLFEQGTDGAKMRGLRGKGNGGGLGFAPQAKNCEVVSFSLEDSGKDVVEPINVVISGTNNHVRGGTITCSNGSRAGIIKNDGFLCGIHDTVSLSSPGAAHTGTFMSEGSEAQFNALTVVDGRQNLPGYGVVDMRGVGSRLSGLRVVGYNGDTTSIPVVITQGRAEQPSISGYSQPADLRASGTRLNTSGLAPVIAYELGRTVTLSLQSAVIERSLPDSLLYRLSVDITTTASSADPFTVLRVNGTGTYSSRVVSVGSLDNNSGAPVVSGPLATPFTFIVATAPSVAQVIRATILVELTRP